jgi:hypothetical protein
LSQVLCRKFFLILPVVDYGVSSAWPRPGGRSTWSRTAMGVVQVACMHQS